MIASTDGEIWTLNKHSRGKRKRVAESRRESRKAKTKRWKERSVVQERRVAGCVHYKKTACTEIFISHRKC